MLRAQSWFASVPTQDLLHAQAAFITQVMGALFEDLDAGRLSGVQSIHFHRLGPEVRFRIIGPPGGLTGPVPTVQSRLNDAQTAGLLISFRSEPEGDWQTPDPSYGTDVPGVPQAFTQFLEAISRATLALLASTSDSRVSEPVLWNWLHLVHNPMTGMERHLVEVAPGSAVYRL